MSGAGVSERYTRAEWLFRVAPDLASAWTAPMTATRAITIGLCFMLWAVVPNCTNAAVFLWDAVTRQFTAYGQVWREFDAYYDWMHHGESSIYSYYFGLADPAVATDRARALRFASHVYGRRCEAVNWDATRRMMRSPITGQQGSALRKLLG